MFNFFIIFSLLLSPSHPLHLTIINVEHKKNEKVIEIDIKIFENDLNNALSKKFADFDKKNEQTLIMKYFDELFFIELSKRKLFLSNFEFLGKKADDGAIHFSFKLKYKGLKRVLMISSKLLLELYPDQKSMIMIKSGNKENGFILSEGNTNCQVIL